MPNFKETFNFNLGTFECLIIKDGTLKGPHDKQVSKSRYENKQHGYKTMDILCLLIRTHNHTILIDTGIGEKAIVGGILQNDVGKLQQNLQNERINCSEIDTVILSHAHPDHIGGIIDIEGKPFFSNARYYLHDKEWEYWMSDPDLSKLNKDFKKAISLAIQKNLTPIHDRLILVRDGSEIVPGIRLLSSPGHTPGHINLLISSGNVYMQCIFDMMHDPSELERPTLFKGDDIEIEQAVTTKIATFSRVAKTRSLVFASHFPFPGLGYILQNNNNFVWLSCKI